MLRVVDVAPINPKPAGTPLRPAESESLKTLPPEIRAAAATLQPLARGARAPSLWRAIRLKPTE